MLINGQRINNKNYTGGVGGAVDQLQRTPAANVDRIEIVDAASLGIAGLSGQVANADSLGKVTKATGQFEWGSDDPRPLCEGRIARRPAQLLGQDRPGRLYLFRREPGGRGAYGGPIRIYDLNRNLTETRTEVYHSEYDAPVYFRESSRSTDPAAPSAT